MPTDADPIVAVETLTGQVNEIIRAREVELSPSAERLIEIGASAWIREAPTVLNVSPTNDELVKAGSTMMTQTLDVFQKEYPEESVLTLLRLVRVMSEVGHKLFTAYGWK